MKVESQIPQKDDVFFFNLAMISEYRALSKDGSSQDLWCTQQLCPRLHVALDTLTREAAYTACQKISSGFLRSGLSGHIKTLFDSIFCKLDVSSRYAGPNYREGIERVTVSTVTNAVSVRTFCEQYYRDTISAPRPEIDYAKVSETLASTVCYFPEGPASLDMSAICALVQEIHVHTDSVFTVASAVAWGSNFEFDINDIAPDVTDFYQAGGLSQLAGKKLGALQQSWLSVERIDTIVSDSNPDRCLLFESAIGIHVPVSTGF